MKHLWSAATSLRTTVVLLSLVCVLLVLNVLLPQASLDAGAYARALRSGPAARFALETLRLGHVATSPAFIAVLAGFFTNLLAVLLDRTAATLRRVRYAPPSRAQLEALLAGPGRLDPAQCVTDAATGAEVLRDMGYRTERVGTDAVWGVKHRLAPLGFPLFHASFFLICAGAVQLYLTRDVVTVTITEGMEVDSRAGSVIRRALLGPAAPARIALERVDAKLEAGRPVALAATIALDGAGPQTARINDPAVRETLSVLVEGVGIAPVLWLADRGGFTLDRVLVPLVSAGGLPTRVALAPGDVEVVLEPVRLGPRFPERGALATVPVELRVRKDDATVFEGAIRPGEIVPIGDRSLRVAEVRYWAGFRLVDERGGGLLVAGFVVAIAGIVWRMVLFRREIAIASGGGALRIAGRGEFFPARFREELALARELVISRLRAAPPRRGGA